MNGLDRFVCEQNVSHYFDCLEKEHNLQVSSVISKLLLDEENKFAAAAGFKDRLETFVEKCDVLLQRFKGFDGDHHSDASRATLHKTIDNIVAIRQVAKCALNGASQRLNDL